ncbi:MAG TPA: isovaleryl-CoA dehydrogenase [Actinomycetota bacterium]|nr:isovaleryl-CoA dehydrogenase [Actinomycetota bacterium]
MVLRDGTHATHQVLNQPPPLGGHDLFATDAALAEAVRREGADWAVGELSALGRLCGSEEVREWGRQANDNPPVLHTHDRYGNRIDRVDFHPAWHRLMEMSVSEGVHCSPWADPRPGAHVARGAKMMLVSQADGGHGCPISMTYSAVPALAAAPDLAAEWGPRFMSRHYDPAFAPAPGKAGALCGMAMTEKQGGSDVRTNTTTATPIGGDEYEITGHKWFCSAPMCDAFLVLAQAPAGLSCYLLPRWRPDGTLNAMHLQRLKDKLGNHSNASSEVEFYGAWARLVGEEGRGVRTIIEMVNHTRLDCVLGSAAGMRTGVAEAIHHTSHRSAFGKLLAGQPLMRNVLADLALESEAATVTAMRLARAYDRGDDPAEGAFRRLATAVSKYWVCKRGPVHAAEALECLGGNGFVEESGMPRLFRDSPLNSIWEGSGNVICLDVLRALVKAPHTLDAFLDEVRLASGADARLDRFTRSVTDELAQPDGLEARARRVVERMALALQASLVVRHSPPAVSDAFCASRLDGDWGRAFGTLPADTDVESIVDRARPAAG